MKKYKSECVKIAAELTCFALTGSVAASGTGSAPASASASATGSAPGSASAGVEVSRPVLNGYYAVTFCPVWRGWGKETNAAGAVYEGKFDNGKFHGQGKLTGPDGTVVLEGTWKDGYHEAEYAEAIDALTAEVGLTEEAQKLYGRPSVSDEEAQELGSSPPLVFGTLPDGLTEHMYFFLVRAWRVHGREAAAYVKRCNAELEMGFTEDDGYGLYAALKMSLHELPLETVTKEHMMLFVEKCKADESAQLQVVSAAVDLTAALDQLDETE